MSDTEIINQRIACKAVIVKNGKVLVLREASYDEATQVGRYGFPGGRLNPGEPFLDGLQREVREETGLVVSIGKPIFIGEWFPVIKEVKNQIVAIFFVCEPITDVVTLSEEHDEYKWINLAESEEMNFMSPENDVLTTYFASA